MHKYSVSLFYEVQLEALEPKLYKLLQSKPIAREPSAKRYINLQYILGQFN